MLLFLAVLACAPTVDEGGYFNDDDHDHDIVALDDDAAVEDVPGTGDLTAELFSDDVLPHFEILLDDDAWDVLAAEDWHNRYNWVQGIFIYDGVEYGPVGVRTKGENSWQNITAKPSIKVQFDRYIDGGEFMGLSDITLNGMNDDYSMMHERVAYLLYRAAGVAAARATHATLTINGEHYGLYTHLETVDKRMMGRWYDDASGPLFEQHDVDFYDYYVDDFELEYGDDDRTALQGVSDAMELGQPSERIAAASEHLDYERFRLYWAVGAFVAQFDAYPYSSPGDDCHVFFDRADGRLDYVPHGVDETFYHHDANVIDYTGGVLGTVCLRDDACRDAWIEQIWDVVDLAEAIDLVGYVDMVADQVAPIIAEDTHTSHPAKNIEYYQDLMRDMVANRREQLEWQLEGR